MPRIALTVTLVDDENRPLAGESWSPLGYGDLGNPYLAAVEATLVNGAERNLLERLRTSIDRSLLIFARRERRRWNSVPVNRVEDTTDAIFDDIGSIEQGQIPQDLTFERECMGQFMQPDPTPFELTESQRRELIAAQPMVEDQRGRITIQKKPRPVRRLSRYKREPII
jgi:hypothetical protein